jgi:hypothetical protein
MPAPAALHHTCFVVRDVEGTARRLAAALGIGPWRGGLPLPEAVVGAASTDG